MYHSTSGFASLCAHAQIQLSIDRGGRAGRGSEVASRDSRKRSLDLASCAGAMEGIRVLLVLSVALLTRNFAQGVTPLVLWHGMGKGRHL